MIFLLNLLLNSLAFIQRLPLFLLFGCILFISYVLFIVTQSLSIFLRGFRLCLRLYYGINGVWVRNRSFLKKLPPSVVIVSYQSYISYWFCYSLFPLAQFHILPHSFFKKIPLQTKELSWFQRIIFYLGFFPAEDTKVYKKSYFVDQYLGNRYLGVDYISDSQSNAQQMPFLCYVALKRRIPVYVIELKNFEKVLFASLCAPRFLEVVIKGKIEPMRDEKVFAEKFFQLLNISDKKDKNSSSLNGLER